MNAAPILKSISCLASTAKESFSFGSVKLLTALIKSLRDKAENRALFTFMSELTSLHIFKTFYDHQSSKFTIKYKYTSKAIFSPSLSQSSHKMSIFDFLDKDCKFVLICVLS